MRIRVTLFVIDLSTHQLNLEVNNHKSSFSKGKCYLNKSQIIFLPKLRLQYCQTVTFISL